jgi:hypothetical protein
MWSGSQGYQLVQAEAGYSVDATWNRYFFLCILLLKESGFYSDVLLFNMLAGEIQ